jgi:hypothetical protein
LVADNDASQPLAGLPSQSRVPALHTGWHTPPEQLVPLAPVVEQTVPQPLQLLESVCRFLQVLPPQTVNPPRQVSVQVPLVLQAQAEPLAGTAPQPVQVLLAPWKQLVADNPASQPFTPLPSQSRVVAVHTG